MLAHLGFIVALAVLALAIPLSPACELILIELDSKTGLLRDMHAPVHNRDASAGGHFVFR